MRAGEMVGLCSAVDRSDVDALLVEATFYLRRAQYQVPDNDKVDRDRAITALSQGLNLLNGSRAGVTDVAQSPVEGIFQASLGVAQWCLGMTETARDALYRKTGKFDEQAARYLERYDLRDCDK